MQNMWRDLKKISKGVVVVEGNIWSLMFVCVFVLLILVYDFERWFLFRLFVFVFPFSFSLPSSRFNQSPNICNSKWDKEPNQIIHSSVYSAASASWLVAVPFVGFTKALCLCGFVQSCNSGDSTVLHTSTPGSGPSQGRFVSTWIGGSVVGDGQLWFSLNSSRVQYL